MNLILRKPHLDDLQCFYEIFSERETHHFIIDEGIQNLEGSKRKLSKLIEINGKFKRIYTIEKSQQAVGFIVIHFDKTDHPFISYAIRKSLWGQGVASKALSCLVEKERSNFKSFKAATHIENIASQKVLLKINFIDQGIQKIPNMGLRKLYSLDLK